MAVPGESAALKASLTPFTVHAPVHGSWGWGRSKATQLWVSSIRPCPGQLFCQVFATGVELSFSAECCEPAWGAVTSGVALAPALGGSQAAFLPLVNELSSCP